MSTVAIQPNDELHVLQQQRRTMAYGLVWGGVMTAILGVWLKAKFDTFPVVVPYLLLVAAAAVLGLGIRNLWRRIPAEQKPEEALPKLNAERKAVGTGLLVAAVVLVLLAAWLGFQFRLQAFGEVASLAVFALIAFAAARWQTRAPGQGIKQERVMQWLIDKKPALGLFMSIAGLVLGVLAFVLRANNTGGFPEWAGALGLGIVFFGNGVWLQFKAPDKVNLQSMRLFVLTVGGFTGLVVAVATLLRAWAWRHELFFAGITAWTGEGAWRIWLCGYLELFGLALMFGSLLLARADIRINPVFRRAIFGYNTMFTGVLLLAFLVLLNVVVYAVFPFNFDWTQARGLYALSDSSQDILTHLKKETTVYVLLSSKHQEMYKHVRNVLDNCQALTNKLKVKYIDPDRDVMEYQTLAGRYKALPTAQSIRSEQDVGRGLLVVYGEEVGKDVPPHELIGPRKIIDQKFDPQGKTTLEYNGERALMSSIRFLMADQKKGKVYFLQGNEEIDIKKGARFIQDPRMFDLRVPLKFLGGTRLVDRLKKENVEVLGLSFRPPEKGQEADKDLVFLQDNKDKKKEIPEDASVVIIAGPSKALPKEELDALERYMEQKGRLVVLLDLMVDAEWKTVVHTGLEEFLKKYNVEVTDEYVFHFVDAPSFNPRLALVTPPFLEKSNVLVQKFRGKDLEMRTVRLVKPLSAQPKFKAEPLLYARSENESRVVLWAEKDLKGLLNPGQFLRDNIPQIRERLRRGTPDLPVGVTVTEGAEEKPRLVVIGDAEFVSNEYLISLEDVAIGDQYFNFFASIIDWLVERPGAGGRPKETAIFSLSKSVEAERMILIPGWLMTVAILGLGLGVWIVRRR